MSKWILLVFLLSLAGCKTIPLQAQLDIHEGHTVLRVTIDHDHDEFHADSLR